MTKTKPSRHVWFPEDDAGELHPKNPDNGCGGGKFKLETWNTYCYLDVSSMSPPNLIGKTARDITKFFVLGSGWQQTMDVVNREWRVPIDRGGCGGKWEVLEEKLMAIDEPCWAAVGQLWGHLHQGALRLEEQKEESSEEDESNEGALEKVDMESENEDSSDEDCWSRSSSGTRVTACANDSLNSSPCTSPARTCTCVCPEESDTHEAQCACKCAECVDYTDAYEGEYMYFN